MKYVLAAAFAVASLAGFVPLIAQSNGNAAATNPMRKAHTLGFKASGVIKRTGSGVGKYAPLVGDATTLTITAAFEKKAG